MKNYTAQDILNLLYEKYSLDKFLNVQECKADSTWFSGRCPRMDLWTMARSWAHPRFIGSEIKVSRSDFLNDKKWPDYLPYCTEFYFVTAHGIADASEVPEQAGLMEATKNCKRLIVKKKAPVRAVEIPQSILIYILMCRVRVVPGNTNRTSVEVWKDRLAEMKSNKKLGHEVKYMIRRMVDEKVSEVRRKNDELERENQNLQGVKEVLDEMGYTEGDFRFGYHSVRKQIKKGLLGLNFDLAEHLKEGVEKMNSAIKTIEKIGQ